MGPTAHTPQKSQLHKYGRIRTRSRTSRSTSMRTTSAGGRMWPSHNYPLVAPHCVKGSEKLCSMDASQHRRLVGMRVTTLAADVANESQGVGGVEWMGCGCLRGRRVDKCCVARGRVERYRLGRVMFRYNEVWGMVHVLAVPLVPVPLGVSTASDIQKMRYYHHPEAPGSMYVQSAVADSKNSREVVVPGVDSRDTFIHLVPEGSCK
ncbi:hypothetical protein DEU56DRAFT_756015 [Suillus clintonianus]|uniref:uncharacterized protein n=1 Tax=Suillus clintonianus TaxID=1904413 RepID=UPI001B86DDC2|nr:uncharacterized protein DEU56DRAFT_756015 [Suillus clintonianus]KAG2137997.1 hypothetical protein DEU56DRAFT_756015 [Suillus clintonianus]